jgi:crossover junction endonuclease MUS81
MKIIIDEREALLYQKCDEFLKSIKIETVSLYKQVLPLGDILLKTDDDATVYIIERKSFQDLFSSIKDGRYEEQSYRLTHNGECSTHQVVYLLEGVLGTLRSPSDKKLLYSTMCSLNLFKGMSVFRTSSQQETAEMIIYMADKIERNMKKGIHTPNTIKKTSNEENTELTTEEEQPITSIHTDKNYCTVVKKVKKENITKENIGQIILCQIPGISSTTAVAIMKNFTSFSHFIQSIKENPGSIENLTTETNGKTRKINKKCIESIKEYLL